jgi:spermidine synthase
MVLLGGLTLQRPATWLLLFSVVVIATCGLIYELIAGTLASYLLGDSITQFSTVIGCYLFAMGIGSWLSRFVRRDVLSVFIRVELMIGLIGGFSAFLLFWLFGQVTEFRVVLYGLITLIGTLVGLEIPLLLRLLKEELQFEELVARVLSLDYVGALAASLVFPLVLVPYLGLMRSAFLFGFLNAVVGLIALRLMKQEIRNARGLTLLAVMVLGALVAGFVASDRLLAWTEGSQFPGRVVFATSTPYQRIVLSRQADDLRLYLNGNLQFSSRDEYRYHEALVHPVMSRHVAPRRVLVLGGGDGLAVREILKYPAVEHVTLVDLDAAMTRLFQSHPLLTAQNQGALSSPRVQVVNADAFSWLAQTVDQRMGERFDVVIIDFPDPTNFSLGKLYSTAFYQRLSGVLAPGALVTVQGSSPLVGRQSFWCVVETMRASGFTSAPYHCYVPSFGEWGYVLAQWGSGGGALPGLASPQFWPEGLRFLTPASVGPLFDFPPDMSPVPVVVNQLNNQALVRYFEAEWRRYLAGAG